MIRTNFTRPWQWQKRKRVVEELEEEQGKPNSIILFPSGYIFSRSQPLFCQNKVYVHIQCGTQKNSLLVKSFVFFIFLHTYKKLQKVTEIEKEKLSCIAVFQISFQPTGSHAEAWGESNQKLGAGEVAYLAGFLQLFVYKM